MLTIERISLDSSLGDCCSRSLSTTSLDGFLRHHEIFFPSSIMDRDLKSARPSHSVATRRKYSPCLIFNVCVFPHHQPAVVCEGGPVESCFNILPTCARAVNFGLWGQNRRGSTIASESRQKYWGKMTKMSIMTMVILKRNSVYQDQINIIIQTDHRHPPATEMILIHKGPEKHKLRDWPNQANQANPCGFHSIFLIELMETTRQSDSSM